jgi:hypothetical protein
MVVTQCDIRTQYLPKTSLMRYRYRVGLVPGHEAHTVSSTSADIFNPLEKVRATRKNYNTG